MFVSKVSLRSVVPNFNSILDNGSVVLEIKFVKFECFLIYQFFNETSYASYNNFLILQQLLYIEFKKFKENVR